MTEKRPSWKDILWTPVYDFVDVRWGTRGLRVFAISIAAVVAAVAFWGLSDKLGPTQRGSNESMLVVDLSDEVQEDLGGRSEVSDGYAAWKSELDAQSEKFVRDLREQIRSVETVWSHGISATAVLFRGILEKGRGLALPDVGLDPADS